MKKNELLRALVLNGINANDIETQYEIISKLSERILQGDSIDADEFDLLVEDAVGERAVSPRKARKLIEKTNAFLFENGQWKYNQNFELKGHVISFSDFINLFMEKTSENNTIQSSSDPAQTAIINGIKWMLRMTELAIESGDINGLPAFYSCNDVEDRLIGVNTAGTATSDALSMLCTSPNFLSKCGKTANEIAGCLNFLIEKTIACQSQVSHWDKGGFMPLEDQPESDHPTVEATCLSVMALATYYENKLGVAESISGDIIKKAIYDGLDFLFRMRLSDGSFGTYRYEDGIEASPNENCTRLVQLTMGVCKGSGLFDSTERTDMYSVCNEVIIGTYRYLCEHTAEYGELTVWAPYFGARAQDYSTPDVTFSAARVCRSFIPVWYLMENERDNIVRYNENFLRYWRENEEKVENAVGYYRFNSPSENGFSAGEYIWPSRVGMLAAFSVLQAYNMFGLALTKRDWDMIDRTVAHTMDLQHPHGHWDNPLAEKTPFCAVTLVAIELLQEYRKAKEID